ncbi:MAG: exodeoxyribonuclease VII large subunit [Acidiferrobacterales bacterium]
MENNSSQPALFDPHREIYTVSRLNRAARQLLEDGFPPFIWVEGEISNLVRASSGHVYFSLKDNQAHVRCALFRSQLRKLETDPENGSHVLVRARISLYEGRGEFQLIVEELEEAGEGALRRALEVLKRQLAQEGLFALTHKKALPRLAKHIGIVTSPAGAVVHDIIITLRRRFPAIPVLLYPVSVQGTDAAAQITAALQLASKRKDCDALILARGGGSLEDLQAFNTESVARAIFACDVPIVCGVGHETDVTIADLVADVRAPTPTAAAELLSPDQQEWAGYFREKERRLTSMLRGYLANQQQRLDWLATRLIHPQQRIGLLLERFDNLQKRLYSGVIAKLRTASANLLAINVRLSQHSPQTRMHGLMVRCEALQRRVLRAVRYDLERRQQRLRRAAQSLHTLSPLATLDRGYAIIQRAKMANIIRDARDVEPGDVLEARLARGRLECIVDKVLDE